MDIRQAQQTDVNAICATDHIAEAQEQRREFIRKSLRDGNAYVALIGDQIVGYSVLEHSFFAREFIAMLMVHSEYRRRGVGSALVRHMERLCKSDRIFTSTNESDLPMQALLEKLGYTRSGVVRDLDPKDTELLYSKQLEGQAAG